jgi:hypothetical protein
LATIFSSFCCFAVDAQVAIVIFSFNVLLLAVVTAGLAVVDLVLHKILAPIYQRTPNRITVLARNSF